MRKFHRVGILLWRLPTFCLMRRSCSGSAMHQLCTNLNINENEAKYLCHKHPHLNKLTEQKVKSLMDTLQDLGYPKQVLFEQPLLFGMLPVTLKFRYKVLMECGIEKVSTAHLVSYLPLIKQKTIGQLKRSGDIPNGVNVENRLASYMTNWPTSVTSLMYTDVNDCTLYSLRLRIIQRYLELILELTKDEFNKGLKTYPTIQHRPLEAINETLGILQAQIMMPVQKIKSNLYLVHADPDNLKQIIYNFRSIGGIDMKEILRLHPKLATKNYSTLVEIRHILQEYNISDEAQTKCFDIYTLSPKTVRERFEKAKTIPEIQAFFNHPRFLKIIHYNNTVLKRLSKLTDNNKHCLSLNVLSSSSGHYGIFANTPGDKLGKGRDLLFCISESLNNIYSKSDIRNLLKRHPFWINTPVVQVKFVCQQLSSEFSAEDIYQNCPILLYPWNKIREILDLLNRMQNGFAFDFLEKEHLDLTKLNKSQKLSLTLYLLEKNHYFSGNGVWNEKKLINMEPVL